MLLQQPVAEILPAASNLAFVEELYAAWRRDPRSVGPEWRALFERPGNGHHQTRVAPEAAALQDRVDQLVRAYRVRGHLVARLDPLGGARPAQPELDPRFYGLEGALDLPFSVSTLGGDHPAQTLPLRKILEKLQATYCRSIGVQFMHIDDIGVKRWLTDRMEASENSISLDRAARLRILKRLTEAAVFEDFIQKKYLGAKSFSLEGAESLIPLLELAIERAAAQGIDEIVLAMAHRGRLSVLAAVMGKAPAEIFREFEDRETDLFHGDVKYHLGHSHDWIAQSQGGAGKRVHLSLCFNPSHLELIDPIAVGRVRAKQDGHGDRERRRGMPLLIHGDAAFAGEGVVPETLNLSQLPAYTVGGTLHVIVNNQLGFTTPPEQARSSTYASEVARMLPSPIFHVNGEDPEAVAWVVELAMEFRNEFRRDVVIDMYCYRRRGHNEGDEPAFTQPLLYRELARRRPLRERYLDNLLSLSPAGDGQAPITREEADKLAAEERAVLEAEFTRAHTLEEGLGSGPPSLTGIWAGYAGGKDESVPEPETGVAQGKLSELILAQTRWPTGFHPHPKLERAAADRRRMAAEELPLDWGAAESLAFASLALEGFPIRLTGQDSERGTFSQRHAVLHDVQDGHTWVPLASLSPTQARVEIANSPLSETAVLGFEYGYSLDAPGSLVLWEAQFGDFVNVAQPVIDQFLAASEEKWRRLSGIALLLPHGFEGMGPEHSSARMERFLALAANDNLQVCVPSTPAQYFHLLRRQAIRRWRKPLVVMTPKSLLRLPESMSPLRELSTGRFQRMIGDPAAGGAARRVLLCTGKIFYDLARGRRERKRTDVAILRLEQLYPLADGALEAALAPFGKAPAVWVQEEPENMGAWPYLGLRFGSRLELIARRASASPATGSAAGHRLEQERLVARAFGES